MDEVAEVDLLKIEEKSEDVSFKSKNMLEKLKSAAPYNIFFNTIPDSEETLKKDNSVTFTDLLCPSLGDLKCSLQINFLINGDWLMEQYKERGLEQKPLTILWGYNTPKIKETIDNLPQNVTHHFVKLKTEMGCHHSKIGIYVYDDNSLRVVISTANLYRPDWEKYNNSLWVSPLCRPLAEPSEKAGESPTGFKFNLISYFRYYKLPVLNTWMDYIKNADFSDVKVFLITSVPGVHYPGFQGCHKYHLRLILSRHFTFPEGEDPNSWEILTQASSLGCFGKARSVWLDDFLRTLSDHKKGHLENGLDVKLSVIYPTVENVEDGYFGPSSGGCLNYIENLHNGQKWLLTYLHHWKADKLCRTRAMPHIKTYCRISPCQSKLAWFLLTSANISKSAWGGNTQKDKSSYVRSYEIGVLFLPKFFDEEFLDISENGKFPFIYDLPLTKYGETDEPYTT